MGKVLLSRLLPRMGNLKRLSSAHSKCPLPIITHQVLSVSLYVALYEYVLVNPKINLIKVVDEET